DGAIRLGLRYVNGLRQEVGKRISSGLAPVTPKLERSTSEGGCPKCGCDDESMLEQTDRGYFCNVCSHEWLVTPKPRSGEGGRFASLAELVARAGLRRDADGTPAHS